MKLEARSHTDQWYAARRGHLTASRMHDACAYKRDGLPSQRRIDYMMDIVAERMTGVAATHYVTPAMQWGIDHESEAISAFEVESGVLVQPAGYVLHPSIEFFGATPDGVVYAPGYPTVPITVEVKCPTTQTFVEWRLSNEIPERYRLQMLAQMACCRTRHGIFVAYDPRIRVGRNLIWHPLILDDDREIEEAEAKAKLFLEQTELMFKKVTETEEK